MAKIKKIFAREILDSRGNPTLEVDVCTEKAFGRAIVPSGASTGQHEAVELRDGDKNRYHGKGVLKAKENVNTILNDALTGMDSSDQKALDKKMIEIDGTENKGNLGANAILGVSMANMRANAEENKMPLFKHINPEASLLPLPMMNIMNGGQHADSGLDIQEFMILPVSANNIAEAVRMGSEIFHTLKGLLKDKGFSTAVGDEGGFAPNLPDNEAALYFIVKAIEKSGYTPWKEVMLGMDVAASEFYDEKVARYNIRIDGKMEALTSGELSNYYDVLLRKYPIISIEDSHDQDDWEGFAQMKKLTEGKIQLVGDDLLVTNVKRLQKAIDEDAVNSILIKLNQIGTVTETIEAIKLAKSAGLSSVVSHRSGETEDTFISDFVVGMETGQIKTGSLSRTDRIAKYNQLIRIEELLGDKAQFAGSKAFFNLENAYNEDDKK